jgi:hypothetical protein
MNLEFLHEDLARNRQDGASPVSAGMLFNPKYMSRFGLSPALKPCLKEGILRENINGGSHW